LKSTWPLRWLVAVIVLTAMAVSGTAFLLITAVTTPGRSPTSDPAYQLRTRLPRQWQQWADAAWQQSLQNELSATDLNVQIRDANGRVIFQNAALPASPPAGSPPLPLPGGATARWNQRLTESIEVSDKGKIVGYISLDHRWQLPAGGGGNPLLHGVGLMLVALFLGVGVSAWLLSGMVMTPLTGLAEAATNIREGSLSLKLPRTPIRELAHVMTAFELMAQGLQAALVQQAAMEEERRFFLAASSHDLRTPLFALRGRLEGLRDGIARTPEQVRHYISSALNSVERLDGLVADLLIFSKFDLLEQSPTFESLDVTVLLHQVIDEIRPRAEAKRIAFLTQIPATPCQLQGDPRMLGRALSNVLDNALTYSPAQQPIRVTLSASDQRVTICVEDLGPGIPADVLPRLFTPQYRLQRRSSSGAGGLGLGLTITKRVIDAHDGTVGASNRAEGGTRIFITLPCGRLPD
jgi:signal transduction histidine kinase